MSFEKDRVCAVCGRKPDNCDASKHLPLNAYTQFHPLGMMSLLERLLQDKKAKGGPSRYAQWPGVKYLLVAVPFRDHVTQVGTRNTRGRKVG